MKALSRPTIKHISSWQLMPVVSLCTLNASQADTTIFNREAILT